MNFGEYTKNDCLVGKSGQYIYKLYKYRNSLLYERKHSNLIKLCKMFEFFIQLKAIAEEL